MPLSGPTHIPPIGEQTDPDKVRVAAVVGGQLASAPARGFGLTADELTALQDLTALTSFGTGVIILTVVTTSGTYTKPAGLRYLEVTCVGGGGAGGGAAATGAGTGSAGGAGASGSMAFSLIPASSLATSITMTVGSGGAGASGAAGGSGGATSFGALVVTVGGGGGNTATANAAARNGIASSFGQSSAGDYRGTGQAGQHSIQSPAGALTGNFAGNGGSTSFGGGGRGSADAAAFAGSANTGAGGGGTTSSASLAVRTGADGGSGLILLKEFY